MKGEENPNFENDISNERISSGNENEMELNNSLQVNVEDDDLSKKAKKDSLDDIDVFSRLLVKVRSSCYQFLVDHKNATKYFITVVLNGVLLAYFIGAIYYYVQDDGKRCIDWCDGVGLLIILYAVVYLLLVYFLILKPYLGPIFYKSTCLPFLNTFDRFWKNRYFRWICYLIPLAALIVYLIVDTETNRRRLISFGGVVAFMLFGFLFSKHPGHINWRPVFWGLALQFIFGLITIRWDTGRNILMCVGNKVATFLQYTNNGTSFVYGHLITNTEDGSIFAFATLPVIYFFSFFVNILSYYGALQWLIMKMGWGIQKVMGTTVCESVNAAASIFLGMTESPLLFRNYIQDLTKSELHAIMCEGWATIAGTVMAAYISFGVNPAHLIAASVMSAPAALCYSKLFYPETEVSKNTVDNIVLVKETANNVLDAACKGAMAALDLVAGITCNIIAFLAFVAFLDGAINWFGVLVGADELSFQYLLSKIFIPVSFLMGVDNESLEDVAILVGTKTVVNEFQAYQIMGQMLKEGKLSPRTEAIATYALCGFSNFSSIGILIGALSALAPSQRSNMTEIAARGFIAANIVCFLTACIAGTLIDNDFKVE